MGIRDHRTKDQLQTWSTHRASEPRHARWAEKRRARASKQARRLEASERPEPAAEHEHETTDTTDTTTTTPKGAR
jgi:hypothetical protein